MTPCSQKGITVHGDEKHPANRGNLCLKGQTLGETMTPDGRLLYPDVYGERCSWDTAAQHIADKFAQSIEQHGADSVAFYVSGQLLTEDYYVVNKFVKGYLGTANIDTNSRLCMASSVAGHKRAFGSDTVPGCYEDLELAELIVLVGSNLAWCHPVLFNRLEQVRQSGRKPFIINIDPRRTATSELSDQHLQIRPDSDTALFTGLLRWLAMNNYADRSFIRDGTSGLNDALAVAGPMNLRTVSTITGADENTLQAFYQRFADVHNVVTVYSQGVNQSVGGTDKVNAIINCHLYTGRIGKPGCGPFSITGQPNAMGGRESGGLANTLTCHMELHDPSHRQLVQNYWQSPTIADKPGLTAVDLFNAVHGGRIKALWIMATNPLVSLPDSNFVAEALAQCEFVVQSDVVADNETSDYAHVRLPAQAWGEKDGTVTNSERCISRQRRFMPPPGEAKPDWWAVSAVAKKLGHESAFTYQSPDEIFSEYAMLSGLENNGSRDFDISACASINQSEYDHLRPFYWPARKTLHETPVRFFADAKFFTADSRARFVATDPVVTGTAQTSDLFAGKLSLKLNTGRTRDQWHTMTRSGLAATLANHAAEPFVHIHPHDASHISLQTADLARISNGRGHCDARVVVTDTIVPGAVYIPMHWCKPFASGGKVNALTERVTDPVSRQPALKCAIVAVEKLPMAHYGFAVSTQPLNTTQLDYFAKAKCEGGWRYEFAVREPTAPRQLVSSLFDDEGLDHITYCDGDVRYSRFSFSDTALCSGFVIDRKPVVASRNWLATQLTVCHDKLTRNNLLAAIKPQHNADKGELICNCMEVGCRQLEAAINAGRGNTVQEIGIATGAGTNCGSCRGDIAAILKRCHTGTSINLHASAVN